MTRLTKPVRRTAERPQGGRPFVVTLYPGGTIGIREHKRRKEFTVPLSRVWKMGIEIDVEAQRKEKLAKKNAARAEKGLGPVVKKFMRKGLWE